MYMGAELNFREMIRTSLDQITVSFCIKWIISVRSQKSGENMDSPETVCNCGPSEPCVRCAVKSIANKDGCFFVSRKCCFVVYNK
jgi:hypothetical protein